MDVVKAFTNGAEAHQITVKGNHENPLFKAVDVAAILGIGNVPESLKDYDEDEKVTLSNTEGPRANRVNYLTEGGLYRIILASRKPFAKQFKKWVCSVIKEIRLTGQYQLKKQVEESEAKLLEYQQERAAVEARALEAEAKAAEEQRRREELELKMKAVEFEALDAQETLYVMKERSEADKRVHKVGFTKNTNAGKRAKSFQTSHASGVDIIYERKVFNAPLVERDVHSILHRYRQQRGEFFTCELQHTKKVIKFAAAVSDTLHGCHESISEERMAAKLIEAIRNE
ncbi:hypothetical protein HK102_012111, partial [Quaeritorhiza haematococci]